MKALTNSDKKLLADIEQHGWHIVHVLADETGPGFSYSVGLYHTFKHPEIIFIGPEQDMTQVLINNIGEDLKSGKTFVANQDYSDILDHVQCRMLEVKKEHYKEYFGYAQWYYKSDDFPVLQCVFPTGSGIFPWDENAPEGFVKFQPIIGIVPA